MPDNLPHLTENPFILSAAGDMFLGEGGTQSVHLEIRVRILTDDATGFGEAKPVTVWTGAYLDDRSNSWGSLVPADFDSGQNFGRDAARRLM